ncbi:MAG: Mrp/NBP35 family ATP-binding protein [Planctomycetota bacterium]
MHDQSPRDRTPETVDQPRGMPMKQGASSPRVQQGTAQGGASNALPNVKRVIAVGAGKGGVGKSTVSVNLAVALSRMGHDVGLLDGDIYGPSAPTLLGLDGEEAMMRERMLQPFAVHGIKTMTIGKLVDPEKPLIWRGPMAHGAFKQLIEQTEWGSLDYLVIDLPPGTGDVPLTMSQMLSLTGAVIVCTPQRVAQDDAVRAARMFQQMNVDVLGVVENMSYFIGDDGKEYDLFGRGGAEQMAQRMGLPFLGGIPINMKLREHSDAGTPLENFESAGDALRESLEKLATRVEQEADLADGRRQADAPTLSVT